MAIRSTAIRIPAGSQRRFFCPRRSLTADGKAPELPFLRDCVPKMLTVYTSQAVLSNHSPRCALRWLNRRGTFTSYSTTGFMADNLRCSAAWSPADSRATSATVGGFAAISASAGWHSEQLASGVTGVSNDPIWPLSSSPGGPGPPQTSVWRAAKPRLLLNCCKVEAWGLGWWDQRNQDAAEKAA